MRSKPLAYHLAKLRAGYRALENERGKTIALSPAQRRLVGAINRLANLPRFLRRWRLGLAAVRAAPNAPAMANGYVDLPSVAGFAEIVALCETHAALYADYLKRGSAALSGTGIDLAAYEAEIRRTADDPLKHVPSKYSPHTLTALANFAMQPALLAVASRHIGLLPVLANVRILYSPNEAGPLNYAQLFHVDPEGARQAKGFMAVRAIGPENSPLTFIPADATRRMLKSGDPAYSGKRVSDEAIERAAPRSEWRSHTGQPGDALMIDTSQCFHFGSRPAPASRLLLYFSYLDPFGSCYPTIRPLEKMRKAWRHFRGGPSPFAEYVLGRRL